MTQTSTVPEIAIVDIAELTEMFGELADQQEAVAAWTGEDDIYERWSGEPQPRWTRAEAAELLRIWQRDAERIAAAA